MVSHPLARESAHYGPVRCIAAAAGRVWTCGGSSAFATFKEWTQSGIHVEQHSMRSMGERRPSEAPACAHTTPQHLPLLPAASPLCLVCRASRLRLPCVPRALALRSGRKVGRGAGCAASHGLTPPPPPLTTPPAR